MLESANTACRQISILSFESKRTRTSIPPILAISIWLISCFARLTSASAAELTTAPDSERFETRLATAPDSRMYPKFLGTLAHFVNIVAEFVRHFGSSDVRNFEIDTRFPDCANASADSTRSYFKGIYHLQDM
jgi:hypothetical protein